MPACSRCNGRARRSLLPQCGRVRSAAPGGCPATLASGLAPYSGSLRAAYSRAVPIKAVVYLTSLYPISGICKCPAAGFNVNFTFKKHINHTQPLSDCAILMSECASMCPWMRLRTDSYRCIRPAARDTARKTPKRHRSAFGNRLRHECNDIGALPAVRGRRAGGAARIKFLFRGGKCFGHLQKML